MIELKHDDGVAQISDSSLLVFVDETGHDDLQDTGFPIFGFGGCLCMAHDYSTKIDAPWRAVEKSFPDVTPLHASDLRPDNTTQEQLNILNAFFETNAFGRFASIISDRTVKEVKEPVLHILAGSTYNRILDLAKWVTFNEIVMIFEASARADKLMADYFSRYTFTENGTDIPVQRFRANKAANISGLMVADFIVHSAGASVQARLKGKITKNNERKDMKAIFGSFDDKLTSFIEINEVKNS